MQAAEVVSFISGNGNREVINVLSRSTTNPFTELTVDEKFLSIH
jgi:hypothetical protein